MSVGATVSILIPAWDEEGAIGQVVRDSLAACHRAGLAAECLVCVDARTTDDTTRIARDAGAHTITQQGHGLTAAVLQIAERAAGGACVVLDGDGQHDGRSVPVLVAPILAGEADVVTGQRDALSLRSAFGRGVRGAARRAGSHLLAFAARVALRRAVPDPLTGLFACRRSDLLGLRQKALVAPPGGYKLLLGLLSTVPPNRVVHVTAPFLPRHWGSSKLDVGVVLTTLWQLLTIALSGRSTASGRTDEAGKM